MVFKSKASAYIQIVRTGKTKKVNIDGMWIDQPVEYACDFSFQGPQFAVEDMPSEMGGTAVDIRGGAFDTESAQQMFNWTDEERKEIEEQLLHLCSTGQPGYSQFWLWERPRPTAPWPNYDTMTVQQIAQAARLMGAVDDAISYETQMHKRPAVLDTLDDVKQAQIEEQRLVAETPA